MQDAPVSAQVRARTAVRALRITRAGFQHYLDTHDAAALRIFRLFTHNLAARGAGAEHLTARVSVIPGSCVHTRARTDNAASVHYFKRIMRPVFFNALLSARTFAPTADVCLAPRHEVLLDI